jgi:adenine-specific DNA-methyltransferase
LLAHEMIEYKRLAIQHQLDAARTQAERNKLGQFATPSELAMDMLEYARSLLPKEQPVCFLDPAVGTGSFLSALLHSFPVLRIASVAGYEIDPYYGHKAMELWDESLFDLRIADFTGAIPPQTENEKANLLICNPPYVRHHHLTGEEKLRLQWLTKKTTGLRLSELAGLYCYFLCLSHAWMQEDGLAGWLIPSEFMDVNYGRPIKQYLLNQVTLLRIHRFDPGEVQFQDALVSSAVVWFRKAIPSQNHTVEFTYGGTLSQPKVCRHIPIDVLNDTARWTKFPLNSIPAVLHSDRKQVRLSDLFDVKRGLVTGANDFFILTPEQIASYQIPQEFLTPILPSPRFLSSDEIEADAVGNPVLEQRLFLLDCKLPEDEISKYPMLAKYLRIGKESGVDQGYICRHRSPWYVQEERLPLRLLCTYMGRIGKERNNPFRFILNHSRATVANVYLMLSPKPELERLLKDDAELYRRIWKALNSIAPEVLMGEGRVYGGGLYKLEPKELTNIPADAVLSVLPSIFSTYTEQMKLF